MCVLCVYMCVCVCVCVCDAIIELRTTNVASYTISSHLNHTQENFTHKLYRCPLVDSYIHAQQIQIIKYTVSSIIYLN